MARKRFGLVLATLSMALAACEREPAGEPVPDRDRAPAPTAASPASIIRPEVMPTPVVEEPLGPLEATIPFAEGGSVLSEAAQRRLVEVRESEQLAEGWPIVLRGHTDSVGHDEANLRTSRRRAEAVAAWLTERGVDAQRIEIVALGEQRPVAPNALPDGTPDEEGRAQNRRVTVTIAPPETLPPAPADETREPEPAPDG